MPEILYHREVGVKTEQRLAETIEWARRIRGSLQHLLDAHGDRIHFRPSSSGVAMVGLLQDRPQRGKSGLTNIDLVAREFEALFDAHCRNIVQGRVTGEKALQCFLIRESYKNARRLAPINVASKETQAPVDLVFVTDEIALPRGDRKVVCDILALRRDGRRRVPVLIELKDKRLQSRLVEQVTCYAALMDEHAYQFARLFGALLGEDITFDGPAEKWIIWPAAGPGRDPREDELAAQGIRTVTYEATAGGYTFRVGAPVS